jgi:hypothetical protein
MWQKSPSKFHNGLLCQDAGMGNGNVITYNNSVAIVNERTVPTEQPPPVGEVSANFLADKGCYVVSVKDFYGCILDFLDRSRYYFL